MRCGVVVLVPEADAAVGAQRSRLDRSAGWGVGAHVTVLFPWLPPDRHSEEDLVRLAAAVASVPAFPCEFRRTAWFDEDVVFLEPEPAEPFRALTRAVWAAFPDHPPYEGAFDDEVTPHLTVGHAPLGTPDDLRAAEAAVLPLLPVRTTVDHVSVLAGRETDPTDAATAAEPWRLVAELPLGAADLSGRAARRR
ncbi:2'-5' RNA ligase family protein [Nocardioides iriomotensis]|uniref:2'-5' RNA ligase family protein n=1 Tax=Nocardioides iriomotensis TaxID=715784 RepID=A0A4Q5IUT7_9ACTN|nr:2'-5' RNA ligase family protein [Nocardioides iriomotensis]